MKHAIKIGKYTGWETMDTVIIKTGRWYVEFKKARQTIFAYSIYMKRTNMGHHIPADNIDGMAYYPFGIHSALPAYAREAVDYLVTTYIK